MEFKESGLVRISTLCESQLTVVGMKDDETFTSILHTIAEKTIPKTSAVPRKLNKPWWTEDVKKYTIIGKSS